MAVLHMEITSICVKMVFVFIKCLHLITFGTVLRMKLFSCTVYSTDVVYVMHHAIIRKKAECRQEY